MAHRAADGVLNRAAPVTSAAPVSLGGYAHTRAECDAVDALRTKVSVIEQLHGRLELVRSIFLHYTAKAMHFKPEVAELPLSMLLMFMKDIKASAARASLTRKCVPPRHVCARRERSTAQHSAAQHSTAQHSTVSRRVGWLESTQQRWFTAHCCQSRSIAISKVGVLVKLINSRSDFSRDRRSARSVRTAPASSPA